MLKGLFQHFNKEKSSHKKTIEPHIIPRSEHPISRQAINPNALKVLYRLHNAGYGAYLVGGCVRDLLLGYQPKDFDIATSARPEEVRKLFKNCRLIGKRFRLAHVVFGRDIIEVATFRTHHLNAEEQHARTHSTHTGMIVRDNVYGSIEDDVTRRDFSVNALYYNIADFSVVDYVGGMQDVQSKLLRMIGDPEQRFHEDPVRMIRAVRFMGKLNLNISPETEEPITRLSTLLQHVSSARLFQEVLKFFQEGALLNTFNLMQKYHLLPQLFPQTSASLQHENTAKLIRRALANTDNRIKEGKTVSPAFLFAVFLWQPIEEQAVQEEKNGMPTYVANEKAIHIILKNQTVQLAIPRQLQVSIRDICFLQHRFTHRTGSRPHRTIEHPRFRAGYDLLMLRAETDATASELFKWWTAFNEADNTQRERLLKEMGKSPTSKKRRKKPRKRPKNVIVTKDEEIK